MSPTEATIRLRALGLRTRLEVVQEAVQRIRNGESLYGLHSGEIPLMAKGTARKIKNLLDNGELGFLFEAQPALEAVRSAEEAVAAEKLPEPLHHRVDGRNSIEMVSTPAFAPFTSESFTDRVNEMLSRLPWFNWNIEHLESIGIPLDEALSLLVERDTLFDRRPHWDRSDLQRYVEIFYFAYFVHKQTWIAHKAPYAFIKLSAAAWAKGLVDQNPFLLATSEHILSYQVWRGPKFLEAFNRAQIATHRAARYLKARYEKLIVNISIHQLTDGQEQDDG